MENQRLSAEEIKSHLKPEYKNNIITVYETIESTNLVAKVQAAEGADHGSLIVSEQQTSGRGRLGRTFFSPPQTGIYMSVVLRLDMEIADAILITSAAAVAVCRAISSLSAKEPKIKWVNDIFLNEKKICGILAEAVTDSKSGQVASIIVGIGVNVLQEQEFLPDEIKDTAGALISWGEEAISRNQLIAEITNELLEVCKDLEKREFIKEYKQRSFILGENIIFYQDNQWHPAKAIDIDLDGGLVIENEHGSRKTLHSGEISVRKSR